MILSKSYYLIFTSTLMLFVMILSMGSFTYWNLGIVEFTGFPDSCQFNLGLSSNYLNLFFLLMVTMVTSFVALYSEWYFDAYNMKKYPVLMVSFFFSMLFLCASESPLGLLLGWDYLGISSIFLIMFYSNKNNMSNSIWTMFYNRVGDCAMVLMVCVMMLSGASSLKSGGGSELYWLMMLCIFTKSAQFPFSTWLPLAMSAPTPISAMVHSSTLVTAGFLVSSKCLDLMSPSHLELIKCTSCVSFLLGGAMALGERDYKKIIAFSTMSQISMVIMMFSSGMKVLALTHMLLHAFFKSFLFMSAGGNFLTHLSDQTKSKMNNMNVNPTNNFFSVFSLISMTGVTMSMSFFTKDLCLELYLSEQGSMKWFTIMACGAIFTMVYSAILMGGCTWGPSRDKSFFNKKMPSISLFYIMASSYILISIWTPSPFSPMLSGATTKMMGAFILGASLLGTSYHGFSIRNSTEIGFSKFPVLLAQRIYSKKIMALLLAETSFFKKQNLHNYFFSLI